MQKQDNFKIFVVEDDPAYMKFLQYVLDLNPDFEIHSFNDGSTLLKDLHQEPDLITLDYSLPDMEGTEVLQKIKAYNENIPVIIISGQEKIGTAVTLIKYGAYDYITKDKETKDRLLNAINNARKNVNLSKEVEYLRQEVKDKYEFSNAIIGSSPAIKQVFSLMSKAVKTNITVSITGETGTGKEMVAKAIHFNSSRAKKPFVAVNLAAVPANLIESELFGHEKGAFTGAINTRKGKFEEANGGTLFLDEIGELQLDLQAKLLRVLQEKELVRVGGSQNIQLDCRILVATHRNLAEEVKAGKFREDLYYRLLGLPVELPPLRDRGHDIILLARHFLDHFTKENNLPNIKLGKKASEKLMAYGFPGNVRELKSVIELAAVLSEDNELREEDIQLGSLRKDDDFMTQERTLAEYNHIIIERFLEKYNRNVLKVAKKLGVGKSTIYRYLNETENGEESNSSQ